jgi:type IV pilus assembly protein PilO
MLFREKQQLTIFIVAAVFVGGFVLFRYLPLRGRMQAIQQIKSAQAHAIAKGNADNMKLSQLNEQFSKLQHEIEKYEAQIPNSSDIGIFLHKIADLMNKHNLSEQMIEPYKEIEAENLNCIPVKMQCKGKLFQIYEFFRELQGLDRLVRIEKVKLSNDNDFKGQIGMEARAIIYYRTRVGQG